MRVFNQRETRVEGGDDIGGFVHRQRGLAYIRQLIGVGYHQIRHILHRLHQQHFAAGQLPHCAFHFHVPRVPNHNNLIALRIQPRHLLVHFGNQRASGIKHAKTALGGFGLHRFGYAMRRVNQRCALRHIRQVVNKNRAFIAQAIHHKFVVHDFVAHINRRAK